MHNNPSPVLSLLTPLRSCCAKCCPSANVPVSIPLTVSASADGTVWLRSVSNGSLAEPHTPPPPVPQSRPPARPRAPTPPGGSRSPGGGGPSTTVRLGLSGQGLKDKDFFGKSDPYYVIF